MKTLLVLFTLISGSLFGQIAYETTYPTNTIVGNVLGVAQLSSSGYKYVKSDTDQIVIYNLNHSVFRTIVVPPQADVNYFTFSIKWVSEELFNLDSSDIEYVMTYSDWTTGVSHVRVYDETGTLLFSRDSFNLGQSLGYGIPERGIVYTSAGVKMLLTGQNTSQDVEVYGLPGSIPCHECSGSIISGIQPNSSSTSFSQQLPTPFPNPTQSSITLPYSLPSGTSTGEMVIYDVLGREVNRYSVTNAFTSLILSVEDLSNGTYSYTLDAGEAILPGRQFIIAK